MQLQDLGVSIPDSMDVDLKTRSRWYNYGKRAKKKDLTVVVYENGKSEVSVDGKEINLHYTDKTTDQPQHQCIYKKGVLVALRTHDNLVHILTDDQDVVREVVSDILSNKEQKAQVDHLEALKTFCQNWIFNKKGVAKQKRRVNRNLERARAILKRNEEHAEGQSGWQDVGQAILDSFNDLAPLIENHKILSIQFSEIGQVNCRPQHPDITQENFEYVVGNTRAVAKQAYTDAISEVRHSKKQVKDLTSEQAALEDRLAKIQAMDAEETATTIWRLLNKSEGYSHFEVGPSVIKGYTNEIVLTMSAMAKGEEEITWSYRMGKFCVQVKPSQESLNVRVFPHDGSKDVAGYYHPHVNQRGELCTGNMEELLQESCNRMDVVSTFLITYKLLSLYNPESPYRHLHYWPKIEN